MSAPSRIYKYESLTTRTLQNLKGQIIYFGSPLNFNDPYDCALTPNFKSATDAEVEEIRGAYLRDGRVARAMRAEFEAFSTQQLREMLLRVADSVTPEECYRSRRFLVIWGMSVEPTSRSCGSSSTIEQVKGERHERSKKSSIFIRRGLARARTSRL